MRNITWKIDHTYRDAAIKAKIDGYPVEDEFASRVSIDRDQQWGIQNAGGIRPLSSGSETVKDKKLPPAAIFLVTTLPDTIFHNPWEDTIDYTTGTVTYWGDARFVAGKSIDDWKGNTALKKIYDNNASSNTGCQPPILYFTKERAGHVTFKGLCIIEHMEKAWFMDRERRVENYRFQLGILNVGSVNSQWLIDRAKNNGQDPSSIVVPAEWIKYKRTGNSNKLVTWNPQVRPSESQRPSRSDIDHA